MLMIDDAFMHPAPAPISLLLVDLTQSTHMPHGSVCYKDEPQADIDDWCTQTHANFNKKSITFIYQAISIDDLKNYPDSAPLKRDITLLLNLGQTVFLSILRQKSCKHDRKIRWLCTPCINPATHCDLTATFENSFNAAIKNTMSFGDPNFTQKTKQQYQFGFLVNTALTSDVFCLLSSTTKSTKAQAKDRFKLFDIIHPDHLPHPSARLGYNKAVRAYNILKNTERRNAFARWCRTDVLSYVISMDYKGDLLPDRDPVMHVGKPILVKPLLAYTKSDLQFTQPDRTPAKP